MSLNKFILFIILFSFFHSTVLFAQGDEQPEVYIGGYEKLHNDIGSPILNLLRNNKKHGYFFLLYEIELKNNRISSVRLINDDSSPSFSQIGEIIKSTEKNWNVSGRKKTIAILPIIVQDLNGECFGPQPMFDWFSGDKFKKQEVKHCLFIPPLAIGQTRPVRQKSY